MMTHAGGRARELNVASCACWRGSCGPRGRASEMRVSDSDSGRRELSDEGTRGTLRVTLDLGDVRGFALPSEAAGATE